MNNVSNEVKARLRAFRDEHGRLWKSKLRGVWERGEDWNDPLLRRARNVIGPCDLDRVSLEDTPAPVRVESCCREPKVRGGRCDNCGQWLEEW